MRLSLLGLACTSVIHVACSALSTGSTSSSGSSTPAPLVMVLANGRELEVAVSAPRVAMKHMGGTLWTMGEDGLELGTLLQRPPSASYDPYWLEDTGDALAPAPPADLRFETLTSWSAVSPDPSRIQVTVAFSDGAAGTLEFTGEGARVRVRWLLTAEGEGSLAAYMRVRMTVTQDEAFYGLGGWPDAVNHRGKLRPMQMEADLSIESANNEIHVPVPLLISTAGWGVFVESTRLGVFDVARAQDDRVAFTYGLAEDVLTEGLQFHLLASDVPLSLVGDYHAITGQPLLPATWAYGPWIWRDENQDQAEVEDDIRKIRDLDLPTSGLWIDRPYATAVNSFDWKATQFPDPAGMVDTLHAAGLRVALWHTPYLEEATGPLRDTAEANDWFPPRTGTLLNGWGKPMDFTREEVRTWWQQKLRAYTDLGVEGFKLDYAEDVLPSFYDARNEWRFADGSTDRTMHHGYTLLYHRVYAELLPPTGGFLICRSGRWGSQKWTSVIWPGDLDATFTEFGEVFTTREGDTVKGVGGLPTSINMMLGTSASGFPFYGADTGGYRHSPPPREVFIRWAQQTALSSVMQVGDSSSQPPWVFTPDNGRDEEALAIYREHARLHLRLFPYAWTHVLDMVSTGLPITRPFGLVYPEARAHPWDQYLFGRDILVAPVVRDGVRSRNVVLPPGRWVDFHTGDLHDGGATGGNVITMDAPLSRIPLLLREGTILPMLSPTMDTLAPATDPGVESYANDPGILFTRVVPTSSSSPAFVLFDGTRISQVQGSMGIMDGSTFRAGHVLEIIRTAAPTAVEVDGNAVPQVVDRAALDAVPQGWFHDAAMGGTLWVKLGAGPAGTSRTLTF